MYLYNDVYDRAVDRLWKYLVKNDIFRLESFEPIVATLSFIIWSGPWYLIDKYCLIF